MINNEELKGLLFLNKQRMSDKSPDYKGSVMVDGKIYYVSMWKRVGKESHEEFFSLSFKPKEQKENQKPAPKEQSMQQVAETVAQTVGGKTEILDDRPLGEEDVPF